MGGTKRVAAYKAVDNSSSIIHLCDVFIRVDFRLLLEVFSWHVLMIGVEGERRVWGFGWWKEFWRFREFAWINWWIYPKWNLKKQWIMSDLIWRKTEKSNTIFSLGKLTFLMAYSMAKPRWDTNAARLFKMSSGTLIGKENLAKVKKAWGNFHVFHIQTLIKIFYIITVKFAV